VPKGIVLIARINKPKLPAPVTAVTIEGISLVNPSLYLRLSAKNISATINYFLGVGERIHRLY
jgi:hypothetical protein